MELKRGVRCGSVTVDLALIFNSTTREGDVITFLWSAAKGGKLGQFNVSAIKRTRSLVDFEIGTTAAGMQLSPGSSTDWTIVGAALGYGCGTFYCCGNIYIFCMEIKKSTKQ
ncbi:uncharacterized protein LOC111339923 [Stylophora pistillata]|uniref:uncharacterized protein LOC111339923 n=1 Tax=Stylophora pistillata TaxID=50429 RepID=UPI000C03ECCB|nr:uncharacterized protein LOC111339923 [Stylophora pistillata]